jgi:hypothetical protein
MVDEANGNGGQIIFMCKRFNLMVVFTGGNYNKTDFFITISMQLTTTYSRPYNVARENSLSLALIAD